jgi:hypothetical protein
MKSGGTEEDRLPNLAASPAERPSELTFDATGNPPVKLEVHVNYIDTTQVRLSPATPSAAPPVPEASPIGGVTECWPFPKQPPAPQKRAQRQAWFLVKEAFGVNGPPRWMSITNIVHHANKKRRPKEPTLSNTTVQRLLTD